MLPTSISMAKNFLMMIQGDVHSFRGEVLRPLQVLAKIVHLFSMFESVDSLKWVCLKIVYP